MASGTRTSEARGEPRRKGRVDCGAPVGFDVEVAGAMAAVQADANDAGAWTRLGELMLQGGATADAVECFEGAVQARPRKAGTWFNLGGALARVGRVTEAERCFRKTVSIDPAHARAWCNLGAVLRSSGAHDEAAGALQKATQLNPGYGLAWANLASCLEARNQPTEATAAAERALAAAPDDPLANLVRARLHRRAGELDEAVAPIQRALGSAGGELRGRALVEAGMLLDRRGEAEPAFEAWTQGQGTLSQLPAATAVDRGAFPALVRSVKRSTDALLDADPAPADEAPPPVFMIGFPRSGTTLTEQLLAAHPGLQPLEEQPHVERALARSGYPAAFDAGSFRAGWRAETAALQGEPRIVDKLPLNIVHAAALDRGFADGHLVVSLRDPRDVVLSAFMQDFVPNTAMVHFFDLRTAAELYADVMDGWLRLRDRLSIPWLEVRYEDLVADVDGQARRLVGFLGVPWSDAVLDYQAVARGRRLLTPSHQDVTRPIFTRARGRWRRYEAQLAPVLPILAPLVEALGYEP